MLRGDNIINSWWNSSRQPKSERPVYVWRGIGIRNTGYDRPPEGIFIRHVEEETSSEEIIEQYLMYEGKKTSGFLEWFLGGRGRPCPRCLKLRDEAKDWC